uniref:Cytochrome c oxidase assembly factor 6 homolog n=1 Tax=Eptatretus burgeri TaxID=7764 RepID=A0A8C4R223_EPTBU
MSAPSAADRRRCWDARDSLWVCMDENPGSLSVCAQQRSRYEEICPNTWVRYFDRRREYLKYKAKLETEGFLPGTTFQVS